MMTQVLADESKWIETCVIPKIAKLLKKSNENVEFKISVPENAFFLSYVCFLDLTFTSNGKKNEDKVRLVLKRPPFDPVLAAKMNMMMQFHNEILFYTKVARGNSRFPRCIFTIDDTIDKSLIVVENISIKGFNLCPQSLDIPFRYVLAAVSELGRFHAMGYVMKENETEEFYKVVNDIQEARHIKGSWMALFLDAVATRPIDWLRRNNCDLEFSDKMEKYLENAFENIVLNSVEPVEPLSTICHGDFTRNNVFFRDIDGKLEAMLIDFAVIGYMPPGVDLSTFLFLNCSSKDRITKFDEIFKSYHESLINYLREAGIQDLNKYSYEKLLADYKKRAVYGFSIAIFFLPIMHGYIECDLSEEYDVLASKIRIAGGDVMTEIFGKIILELRDTGCLDHVK